MRTAADLVSGIGNFLYPMKLVTFIILTLSVQPHLRPVLGVSNVSLSVWRLDPFKQCCALKGMLPYKEVSGDLVGSTTGSLTHTTHIHTHIVVI